MKRREELEPIDDPDTAAELIDEEVEEELEEAGLGIRSHKAELEHRPEDDDFIPESVDQLLAHSRRYPLLTPGQEIELAKRIEKGDLKAKERLINSNLRLVASNARRYQNQGLPLAD